MKKTKVIVFMLILALLAYLVTPLISVTAATPEDRDDYAEIEFGGRITSMTEVNNAASVTVTYENGTALITGSGLYSEKVLGDDGEGHLKDRYFIYVKGDITISVASSSEEYSSELWLEGQMQDSTTKTYNGLKAGDHFRFDAEFRNGYDQGGGNQGPVQIEGGTLVTGQFAYEAKGDGDPADIWLNETEIGVGESPDGEREYYYVEGSGKVTFRFATFINNRMTSIKINNVDYTNKLPKTKEEWLEANRNQIDVVELEVPFAENYNIETTTTNDFDWSVGNFLWSYKEEDKDNDDYMANGTLDFVSLQYNGKTYNGLEELMNANKPYLYADADSEVGSAVLPAGAKLTVKLVPDAGYQLVSFTCNGQEFETQEQVGYYTFDVPAGNFHWGATFAKVDDVVKASSKKVQSGKIKLGGAETSMAIGTARLDVTDTTVTDAQVEKFKKAAGDYTISNYLDISLFNTVYKGKATSSWDTEVTDLDNQATITLKLDDSIKAEDAQVVHENHDGTYEAIATEFNSATNEVSFATKKFSNYAIATKVAAATTTEEEKTTGEETKTAEESATTKEETKETTTTENKVASDTTKEVKTTKNPSTGDKIMTFVSIFSIALATMIIALIMNKSRKIGKH